MKHIHTFESFINESYLNEASQADSMIKAIMSRFHGGRPGEKAFISMNATGKKNSDEKSIMKGLMDMWREDIVELFKELGLDTGWEHPLTYR